MTETIAIIGTGRMGGAFAKRLSRLGYKVVMASRDPNSERVQTLVSEIGNCTSEDMAAAADISDLIVLAVPYTGIEDFGKAAGELKGKTVLDCTNALKMAQDGLMEMASNRSSGEELQSMFPKANIIKAFNTVGYHIIANPNAAPGQVTTLLAGNNKASKTRIAALANQLGFETADLGPIRQSRYLEGMSALYLTPYLQGRVSDAFEFYYSREQHLKSKRRALLDKGMRPLTYMFLIPALATCQPALEANTFVLIENTTTIDAINGLQENVDVIISGDKILKIVPATEDVKLKGAVTVLDGRSQYVIPGLWDAHVHLSYNANIGHEVFFPLAIAHGVTYLRDTGGHLEKLAEARALSASDPTLPDLYVSGPLLDGERRVYDGSSAGFPDISVGLPTEQSARDYVDRLAEQGVSFVKAYEMLPPEVFAAIGDQAKKHGLPVAMHIPLSMTAEEAVDAGAKDMQHLRNIELSCTANLDGLAQTRKDKIAAETNIQPSKLRSQIHTDQRALALPAQDAARCAALLKRLAAEDVYQTPTLTISRFFTRRLFEDEAYRLSFEYMPAAIASGWYERSAGLKDRSASDADKIYDDWIMQTLSNMSEAGVPIMAGTDAPIGYLTPGASLHEELVMLVDAGMLPMQALRAATYEPARFLGLHAQQGLIAAGMKADLVILRANPLTDIQNIKHIETVIRNGEIIDREGLDKRLGLPSKL